MNHDGLQDLAQLLAAAGAGGVIVEGVRALANRRHTKADTVAVLTASMNETVRLVLELQKEVHELNRKVAVLGGRVDHYRHGTVLLTEQIEEAGLIPVWRDI